MTETYSIVAIPGSRIPEPYQSVIYSKWMRSLRKGNDFIKLIEQAAYYRNYRARIEGLLCRFNTIVRLAVLTETPDVVLGFSVAEGAVLHYVYVQPEQRGQGIGRSLVPAGITTITHLTRTGLTIWGSKMGDAIFNPFA